MRIFITALLFCSSAAISQPYLLQEDKAFSERFGVTEQERTAALAGSARTAYVIYTKLSDKAGPEDRADHPSDYWMRIAAENGDPVSQINYSSVFLNSTEQPEMTCRALFWLGKAATAKDAGIVAAAQERIKLARAKLKELNGARCD